MKANEVKWHHMIGALLTIEWETDPRGKHCQIIGRVGSVIIVDNEKLPYRSTVTVNFDGPSYDFDPDQEININIHQAR